MTSCVLRGGLGRLNLAVSAAKAATWGQAKDAIVAAAAAAGALLSDLVAAEIQRERDVQAMAGELIRLGAEVSALRDALAAFQYGGGE
jgi:hypothetical protein